jgi:hypothetical protein
MKPFVTNVFFNAENKISNISCCILFYLCDWTETKNVNFIRICYKKCFFLILTIKLKWQWRIDNPEKLVKLGTQNTGLRKTKHRKVNDAQQWLNKIPEVNPGVRKEQTVPASYNKNVDIKLKHPPCYSYSQLLCPMFPVSLDCPFCIASSVFPNVYFQNPIAKS